MSINTVIVVGASAGGVEALKFLARELSPDIAAPLLVALHISPFTPSLMPKILNYRSTLPALHPEDGQALENGHIYIAPPDYHLLVKDGFVSLSTGPKENGFRPAIDVLFRTAAKVYRSRVIGVVLTGALDNGSAGLLSIKAHGGVAVVQDPMEAEFSEMPENAIKTVTPDYVLPLKDIPAKLMKLSRHEMVDNDIPQHQEDRDSVETAKVNNVYHQPGRHVSTLSCPECGGVLSECNQENLLHFKCRVGHAFSAESLMAVQSDALENALWAALRALEENTELAMRLAQRAEQTGAIQLQERYEDKAQVSRQHADVVRDVLLTWE